ncbi:hypothetical protein NHQ30_000970 [Ciborinia camelliae]|nr:hypothetical protein NHQ30_000970 [Ciborinia camelliae]
MRIPYREEEYVAIRPQTPKENQKTLSKHWTKAWLRHQCEIQETPERHYHREFRCRLEKEFPIHTYEALLKLERVRKPKRDSMDARERAEAIIRELLYFYPPIMNEIVRGMDHFESFNRDTAKEYINRAQEEIDEEWREMDKRRAMVEREKKRNADEYGLKKAWKYLLRLEEVEPEQTERDVETKCDVIVRTFDLLIKKRKGEKTEPWSVKTSWDALCKLFLQVVISDERGHRGWKEMSWMRRSIITDD